MLINDPTKQAPKPLKIDAYICPHLHATITTMLDGHEGKPPAVISCPQCGMPARSMGRQVNQEFKPVWEWYKPNADEMKAMSLKITDEAEYKRFVDMINKGMLVARHVKKDEEKKDEVKGD